MNCQTVNEYMMRYFDGDRNNIEDEQLMQHLKTCEGCRQEFDCMSEIFASIENETTVEPPENFEASVMEKVNAYEKKRMEKRNRMLVLLYNAATIIAIILLMVFVTGIRPGGLSSAIENIKEYFGSFNSVMGAVFGVVVDIFKLLGGVLVTLVQVFISIIKTYYYIFVMLIVLLFGVQRLYSYFEVQDGRKA